MRLGPVVQSSAVSRVCSRVHGVVCGPLTQGGVVTFRVLFHVMAA
jgi:hypothetical protein